MRQASIAILSLTQTTIRWPSIDLRLTLIDDSVSDGSRLTQIDGKIANSSIMEIAIHSISVTLYQQGSHFRGNADAVSCVARVHE